MKKNKLPGIFTALLLVSAIFNLRAQYALQATHDTTICQGQSVQLNVSGGTTYTWVPSGTLSSSTSASPVATPTQTTPYVVTSSVSASNMVINGDFSAGDTGFTTQYTYEPTHDTDGPGDYAITGTPNSWNGGDDNCPLHGTDVDEMVVDGALTANVQIWCETFHVYPNSTYNLSAYFESTGTSNYPKLQWMVNGALVGNSKASIFECIWENVTDTWNSDTDTSATFCIVDNLAGPATGDDFVLADITITGTVTLTDTVVVTVVSPPVVNIGNDTSLCTGQALTLNATTANSTYLWSTGATTPIVTVDSAGTYKVQVDNGCTVKDSIVVSFTSTPAAFSLGNDTTYCGNFSRVLTTGYANTVWNTNANGAQITVNSPGTYWASETNQCGVTADTIVISQNIAPVVNLGNDTTLCTGQTLSLNATYPSSTYLWSNNSTAPGITVSSAGVYWVQVNNGCTDRDSITVAYSSSPASFFIGNDTTYCGSFSRVLTTGNANTVWSTSANGSQITVNSPGTYWATEANQCGSTSDTIIIGQMTAPIVSLGADTAICSAQTVLLDAGNPGSTYNWNNNTHNETDTTSLPGTYSVTVTSGAGCSASDSVVISSYSVPLSVTSINTSCGTANGTATAVITNGRGPYNYIWNTTATTPGISGLAAGTYKVTVMDANGCTATASASVDASGANSVSVTASSNLICPNDTAQLCANSGFVAYSWSNGDTTQCINTQTANDYSVTVTDVGNCTAASGITDIQVRQPPSVTVSVSGDTLTSYSATSYQWYLNDTLIPGATSSIYVAQVSGNYTVVISDSHGCTATSNIEPVTVSGIDNVLAGNNIKVYPNPLEDGNWMLQVGDNLIGANIQVFDDSGREIYETRISLPVSTLDFKCAKGIYFMRVVTGDKYYSAKLVRL